CLLARADLVFVIDSSTSVTETNFDKILSFVKDLLSKTDIDSGDVRVGLITYSNEVSQEFYLNSAFTKREILELVDDVKYNFGSTNTAEALEIMRNVMFSPEKGDRADVSNIAIVLTDGVSAVNAERTVPNARLAHDDGIHIFTIGVGLSDTRELEGIATPPASQNSFKVDNFDELEYMDGLIFASACYS
ncbi:collagen alpha-1(XIV) chain, partial [Biomphalaria glabrata]